MLRCSYFYNLLYVLIRVISVCLYYKWSIGLCEFILKMGKKF